MDYILELIVFRSLNHGSAIIKEKKQLSIVKRSEITTRQGGTTSRAPGAPSDKLRQTTRRIDSSEIEILGRLANCFPAEDACGMLLGDMDGAKRFARAGNHLRARWRRRTRLVNL